MRQCPMLCRESPRGVSACILYLVNGMTIAVKESGARTCIGCSMSPLSSIIRDETCTRWFAFVSHSKDSARMWREHLGQCYRLLCLWY